MSEKNYLRKLVMLFEDEKSEEGLPPETTSTKIADKGSDVKEDIEKKADIDDDEIDNELDSLEANDKQPIGAEETSSSLSDSDELPLSQDTTMMDNSSDVSEKLKLQKLFDLYRDMIEYERVFIDSLDNIDTNLLDSEKHKKLIDYKSKLDKLENKLKVYITESLPSEKYEKALYNYILMRTELITIVKLLRDVLNLNDLEDKPIQKSKETKEDEQL